MAKASRRGIGKIAAGAIVIVMVAMVVGVGGFFGSQGPPQRLSAQQIMSLELASSSTSQPACTISASGSGNTSTITVTAGQFPPCGCTLADSNSNGSLYVSTDAEVGGIVCMTASLDDSSGVSLSVTNSTGSVVFSTGTCIASALPGAPPSTGISCTAYWNTSKPDPQGNRVESGTYLLVARVGSAMVLEAGFTLF
jgi:hypothetical protein